MKGVSIFICVMTIAGSLCFGQEPPQQQPPQQQRPQPNGPVGEGPGQPQPPPQGGPLGPKTATPQQNIVAVPVPIAPPQPNGPVQKSLVRVTVTEVAPDYRAT